jgi:hypothetical protein
LTAAARTTHREPRATRPSGGGAGEDGGNGGATAVTDTL